MVINAVLQNKGISMFLKFSVFHGDKSGPTADIEGEAVNTFRNFTHDTGGRIGKAQDTSAHYPRSAAAADY